MEKHISLHSIVVSIRTEQVYLCTKAFPAASTDIKVTVWPFHDRLVVDLSSIPAFAGSKTICWTFDTQDCLPLYFRRRCSMDLIRLHLSDVNSFIISSKRHNLDSFFDKHCRRLEYFNHFIESTNLPRVLASLVFQYQEGHRGMLDPILKLDLFANCLVVWNAQPYIHRFCSCDQDPRKKNEKRLRLRAREVHMEKVIFLQHAVEVEELWAPQVDFLPLKLY